MSGWGHEDEPTVWCGRWRKHGDKWSFPLEKLEQRYGSRKVEGIFGKQGLSSEWQGESRVGDCAQGTFQRGVNAFYDH